MSSEDRIAVLEEENQRLRNENEILLNIIEQMRATLNRMIGHYVTEMK